MEVKIKLLNEKAVIPSRAYPSDAGMDITATSEVLHKDYVEYGTGLAIEIPENHVGLLFSRSSVTSKTGLILGNAVGVIDHSYRGEIKFQFRKFPGMMNRYKVGDRIGQLIILPFPQYKFLEVEELSTTVRGEGSFGSSGK